MLFVRKMLASELATEAALFIYSVARAIIPDDIFQYLKQDCFSFNTRINTRRSKRKISIRDTISLKLNLKFENIVSVLKIKKSIP